MGVVAGGGHYLDNEADVQSGAQGFPTSNYRHIGRAASASPRSSSVNVSLHEAAVVHPIFYSPKSSDFCSIESRCSHSAYLKSILGLEERKIDHFLRIA